MESLDAFMKLQNFASQFANPSFFLTKLKWCHSKHSFNHKNNSLRIKRTSMMKHMMTSTVAHMTIPPFLCVLSACNSNISSTTVFHTTVMLTITIQLWITQTFLRNIYIKYKLLLKPYIVTMVKTNEPNKILLCRIHILL